jgi:hypothetical protein
MPIAVSFNEGISRAPPPIPCSVGVTYGVTEQEVVLFKARFRERGLPMGYPIQLVQRSDQLKYWAAAVRIEKASRRMNESFPVFDARHRFFYATERRPANPISENDATPPNSLIQPSAASAMVRRRFRLARWPPHRGRGGLNRRTARLIYRSVAVAAQGLAKPYLQPLPVGLGLDRTCASTRTVLGPDLPFRSGRQIVFAMTDHLLSGADSPWLRTTQPWRRDE